MPQKHSLTIRGHATSITLEDEFWNELKSMAAARHMALAALIAEIDAGRGKQNLSSALRVFVLKSLKPSTGRR